ncbi:hypothetical protein HWV62_38098 [Athelia sp. TMB]|nr:hypothetical protein HWV62_38098 [Athelia sp. TMB]
MANIRPSKKLIPKLKDLQAQMNDLETQISVQKALNPVAARELSDKRAREPASARKSELIPKPSGQKNRTKGGYSLRDAMGLTGDENKKKYDALQGVVRKFAAQYFNTDYCLSSNPELRVCQVIALIQTDQPFFKDYEDGWPVRDMLQTYLTNTSYKAKARQAALQGDKENTPAQEALLSFDDDLCSSNQEEEKEGYTETTLQGLVEPPLPLKPVVGSRCKNVAPKRPLEDEQKSSPLVKKQRKVTLTMPELQLRDVSLSPDRISEDDGKSPLTFTWSELDIPFTCPQWECDHTIPANLPNFLVNMFRDLALLIHDGGEDAKGAAMLTLKICMALAIFRRAEHARRAAEAMGYADLDLPGIVPFVRGMKADLDTLVFTVAGKERRFIWKNLLEELDDMGSNLMALEKGKNNFIELDMQARPGGYGPRGAAIIENTLMSLYGPTDFSTSAIAPLSFRIFAKYILIPHVAIALIIKDENNECDEETGAWEQMVRRADHGAAIHPLKDDDPEIEEIFKDNARFWRNHGGHPKGPKETDPVLPARLRGEQKAIVEPPGPAKQCPPSRPRPTPIGKATRGSQNISPPVEAQPEVPAAVTSAIEQPTAATSIIEELTVAHFPLETPRVLRSHKSKVSKSNKSPAKASESKAKK